MKSQCFCNETNYSPLLNVQDKWSWPACAMCKTIQQKQSPQVMTICAGFIKHFIFTIVQLEKDWTYLEKLQLWASLYFINIIEPNVRLFSDSKAWLKPDHPPGPGSRKGNSALKLLKMKSFQSKSKPQLETL